MKKEQPKNEKDLQECLTRVWNSIEKPVLKKLVDSVPNRLDEVIRMKGYLTRYQLQKYLALGTSFYVVAR